ncbi:hypothetical protein K2X14_11420 [Acetobacter sp. TBRC 12305]|uniref:Uncharacterized protein n=1 Tax=Acetobacter garciniae TaxID=2817435 RepID=A0A939HQ70_9PROT|nr:hypothetical protein [Acetobacter garciniae]MBO1325381.1 hypothetical protein [Acetobacter garciniae]MBX0345447.1 hypothetical protein [Acetobacter garciniae]
MTDQKPTGVFVRFHDGQLSETQIAKIFNPKRTMIESLLAIGTPLQDGDLPVVTTLGTLRDPVPCVRQSDAQAAIAAVQAENEQLREALSHAREAITSDENKSSIVCTVWAGPGETLVDYISATLEGGAA